MEKFGKTALPRIHLDSDGTEIDDEDYFQTLEPNTELIAVFIGEQWVDVSLLVSVTEDKQNLYPFSLAHSISHDNNSQPRRCHWQRRRWKDSLEEANKPAEDELV